jgi:alcohol dehydrogenase
MEENSSQKVIIENGAITRLDALLNDLNAETIFFVVDKPAYEFSGAAGPLQQCFQNRKITWFSDFELNPKLEDVARGKELFLQQKPDVVLALGGGSALDMGKLIASCSVEEGDLLDLVTGKAALESESPPLVAIPTTSGTGSEATHFAVVYVGEKKYSLADKKILPGYVLIDPGLTHSLPPDPTASSGLDALCQAIESIWSVGANDESVGYAKEALQLALDNMETAVNQPTPAARMNMAKAAYLAGKAINITKTTAPHAFSYGVTTRFGVPHGKAVALTLTSFLEFNYHVDDASCNDPRGVKPVKSRIEQGILKLLGDGSMEQAKARLDEIKMNIGSPLRLNEAGVNQKDIPELVDMVNLERLSNNPRKIAKPEMEAMLKNLF